MKKKYLVLTAAFILIITIGSFIYLVNRESNKILREEYSKSPQIQKLYKLKGNSLVRTVKDDPRDRIEITIGDASDQNIVTKAVRIVTGQPIDGSDFTPKMKISRWDEVSATLLPKMLDEVGVEDKKFSLDGDKIVVETPDIDYHMYEVPPDAENIEGGYEYEIILKKKPPTNRVEFSLETEGLKFVYQPPLTHEYKSGYSEEFQKNIVVSESEVKDMDGNPLVYRPENTVGSYAIYTSEEKVNYDGGKIYRTGKAGHIYRPKIIDSAGNETWGNLNIDADRGLLTVQIPQSFLDSAVYPVHNAAGLKIGYDGCGTTNTHYPPEDSYMGTLYTSPSDAGTITNMSACGEAWNSWWYFKGLVSLHSNLVNVTNGVSNAATGGDAKEFATATFSPNPTISPDTPYVFGVVFACYSSPGDCLNFYSDTGFSSQAHYETDNSYASPTSPSGISHYGYEFSIYATYTALYTPTPSNTPTPVNSPTPTPTPQPSDLNFEGINLEGVDIPEFACPSSSQYVPNPSWSKEADTTVRDIDSLSASATVNKDIYCDDYNCILWTDGADAPSGTICLITDSDIYANILWAKANESFGITWSDTGGSSISGGDIGGTHPAGLYVGNSSMDVSSKNWLAKDYSSSAGTYDAMDTCKAKGTGWRLPTILELDSIRDMTTGESAYTYMPNMYPPSYDGSYRSSTEYSSTQALHLTMSSGNVWYGLKTSTSNFTRCVRD